MWGFDSFTGFPAEAADVWRPTDHWQKGGDSAADALNTHSTADLFAQLRRHIGYANLSFVEGYFNESLTAELARSRPFQPAVLIHLDCNMHSSTVQALDWLFQYKLAVPRTIVRYDDWPGNYTDETIRSYWQRKGRPPPPQVWGQMRSHIEATDRFKISWRRLSRNVFEVLSVGRAAMSAIDPASSANCPYPPCS